MNLACNTDPATSHAAAARVCEFGSDHQGRILAALYWGELGAEQIGAEIGLAAYSVRKRLAELEKLTLAEPTGEERRTSTGRSERIWRLVLKQLELV